MSDKQREWSRIKVGDIKKTTKGLRILWKRKVRNLQFPGAWELETLRGNTKTEKIKRRLEEQTFLEGNV